MHSIWSSCEEALENLLSQTFVHLLLDMYGMTMLWQPKWPPAQKKMSLEAIVRAEKYFL